MEDPGQDDQPIKRLASLGYWKKALSKFLNITQKWNEVAQNGNPAQSKKVNKIIKVLSHLQNKNSAIQNADMDAFQF